MENEHLSQNIRVAIDSQNPCIRRNPAACIMCGMCANVCSQLLSVNSHYSLEVNGGRAVCVGCGQCIKSCPTSALAGVSFVEEIKQAIASGKTVFVSTAPAVRVALGDEFGLEKGRFVEGQMVALLKKLGFSRVFDVGFGADMTAVEEAAELLRRLDKNESFPLFTSCCPAWVRFCEIFFPEILPNLSSCKSPIGMQGALIKTYAAKTLNLKKEEIVTVTVTPCEAKKSEIAREEMTYDGTRCNDFVLTTRELAAWAKEQNIDFGALPEQPFDPPFARSSGGGVLFGKSGGVMESALRTACAFATGKTFEGVIFDEQQFGQIRFGWASIGKRKLRVCVCFGLSAARGLVEKILSGSEKVDFVEVMACPAGCVGGGGQPKVNCEGEAVTARRSALEARDKALACAAHENEDVKAVFKDFLEQPNSPLCQKLLHTTYFDRSEILKPINQTIKKS